MSLYRPKVGITHTKAIWLIMLPYVIGLESHKTSCVLFINILFTTYVYELLLLLYIDWCMNFCYCHIVIYLCDV
jgi:hypothetical protein